VIWGPTFAEMEGRMLPDTGLFGKSRLAALLEDLEWERDQEACFEAAAGDVKSVTSVATTRREAAIAANTAAFQEFFANEYLDDDDIGELDDEEIEGEIGMEAIEEVADEYIAEKKAEREEMLSIVDPRHGKLDDVPRVLGETRAIIEKHYTEMASDSETDEGEEDGDESKNWDCETVLSTLSNLSNRPAKIDKFKIKKPDPKIKTIQEGDEKEEEEASSSEEEVVELPEVQLERPKGETSEERRERKKAVKEMRRICRKMKKESKDTFKAEADKLAKKKVGTDDVRQGLRKLRL